jgi:hypothetical protein
MGYYTRYEIQILRSEPALETAIAEKGGSLERFVASYAGFDRPFDEARKWYDHERDMLRISCAFPGAMFMLSGEGEDSADLWREYYAGGKRLKIKAMIVWDEFDESNLS